MSYVPIDLEKDSYTIRIEEGVSKRVSLFLKVNSFSRNVCIITNETIAPLHLDAFLEQFSEGYKVHVYLAKDSEQSKSLAVAEDIYAELIEQNFTRNVVIIALGGGVIGDLAGFVAATYYRGVPFVQVPTTLLAQVDSSVGGKVAVNHRKGKNLIGAFYQPKAVFIDPVLLRTLPIREMICGLAEVLKYGYIWEKEFLKFVKGNLNSIFSLDPSTVRSMIQRCVEIKRDVVQKDERETGIRAYLNFGHTFGHAIEAADGYKTIKHGEAVILGMICALHLSSELLEGKEKALFDARSEIKFLKTLYSLPIGQTFKADDLYGLMKHDKKNVGDEINLILLSRIGSAFKTNEIEKEAIISSLNVVL